LGDLEKNIEFNEMCIDLADKISDLRLKGFGLSNSVNALVEQNSLEKALDYAIDAFKIFKKIEEHEMVALSYMNFGLVFKQKEDWEVAIDNFKSALELMDDMDASYQIAECYRQFSFIYEKKGENARAEQYMTRAAKIYESLGISTKDDDIAVMRCVHEQII
jgi:tetratricopeptide (TPR) repeat protein